MRRRTLCSSGWQRAHRSGCDATRYSPTRFISKPCFIFIDGQKASSGSAVCGVIEHKWRSGRAKRWRCARARASPRSAGSTAACAARRPPPGMTAARSPSACYPPETARPTAAAIPHRPACIQSFRRYTEYTNTDKSEFVFTRLESLRISGEFRAADLGRPVQC